MYLHEVVLEARAPFLGGDVDGVACAPSVNKNAVMSVEIDAVVSVLDSDAVVVHIGADGLHGLAGRKQDAKCKMQNGEMRMVCHMELSFLYV